VAAGNQGAGSGVRRDEHVPLRRRAVDEVLAAAQEEALERAAELEDAPGAGVIAQTLDRAEATADEAAVVVRQIRRAEAVRLWATGKRQASLRQFPAPRAVVGTGAGRKTSNIYAWPEVVSWVREVIGIDPDEGITYLGSSQHAHLNAKLADLVESAA
jgi:hypothetical protein